MIMHEDPVDAEMAAYDGYAMDLLRRISQNGDLSFRELGSLLVDYCNQINPDNWALTNIEVAFKDMERRNEP